MTMEIEMEFLVENSKAIEEKLRKANAKFIGNSLYRDIYFSKKEFYNNNRIRLRKIKMFFSEKKTKTFLTLKTPKIKEGLQTADEKEKEIESFEKKILN